MSSDRPPSIDPVAARRWAHMPASTSPWLHEEVGRRMEERLQWIRLQPRRWVHWEPLRGGLAAHAAVARRYPAAECLVVEPDAARARVALQALRGPWWHASRWGPQAPRLQLPQDGSVQMVWANMALHMAPDPQALIAQWHRALEADGFLMFSCLGPDTLRAVRARYQAAGWPPPAHLFTDMHDWGDMLVAAGFSEPVMDMEHIALGFASGRRALQELRQLGRNLHRARFAALRGRAWREQLVRSLEDGPADGQQARDGVLPVTLDFEIIYGHALKAPARLSVQGETAVPLEDMRRELRRRRDAGDGGA